MKQWFLFLILSCATTGSTAFAQGEAFRTCDQDFVRQQKRSEELQAIVKADQDDRSGSYDSIDWSKVLPRDEIRRKRVGEIFGEGCFKTADDYSAAALVYQHGSIPDHFFQTFLWAKKAVELGDLKQKWLMAAGIDRYLVNTNFRQLFATQFSIPQGEKCWCLDPVEASFPESTRIDYAKKSLSEALLKVKELNKDKPGCDSSSVCKLKRKDSPRGTVPGFW